MKDIINNFFKEFKGQKMTLEELSSKVNIPVSDLKDFFKEFSNYRDLDSFATLNVVHNYYDEFDALMSYGHVLMGQEASKTDIFIRNNYYLDKSRELDMFLAKKIYGVEPVKDQIDDSDIGGLYRTAWVYYHNDQQEDFCTEIPRFTQNSILDLIRYKLPFLKVNIEFNKSYTISIWHGSYLNLLVSNNYNLDTAIALALKEFIEKYNYSFYTIRSYQLGEDSINEGSYSEINNKPLFLDEESAKAVLESLPKQDLVLNKIIKL